MILLLNRTLSKKNRHQRLLLRSRMKKVKTMKALSLQRPVVIEAVVVVEVVAKVESVVEVVVEVVAKVVM